MKKVVGLLIGNKCDCESKVNMEEAEKFAEEHGLKYLETSAKFDKNIRKAIACILEKIIKSKENKESKGIKKIIERYNSLSSIDTDSLNDIKLSKKKNCAC